LFAKWLPLSLKTSLSSWTPASVTLGQAVRLTLIGNNLDAVQSVTSSTGTARIVTKTGDRLEVEITSAALGNGSIQISSPTLVASLGGVFAVVAADSVKLSTFSTRALFSTNSSVLTAQAQRQLIASLKKISDPASIVITGSVAAQRPSAATRALALKRAQAVAAVVAQVFSNVEPKLLVLAPKGTAPLNNSAVVSIQAPATRN
jgi:outer membrane protein OmpA-like peptidoglycan-associated protein